MIEKLCTCDNERADSDRRRPEDTVECGEADVDDAFDERLESRRLPVFLHRRQRSADNQRKCDHAFEMDKSKREKKCTLGQGQCCKLVKGGVSSHRQSCFEPAIRSLATFVRSHRLLRSLTPQCSALLHSLRSLAPFTGSLTHFTHSLVGQLKLLNRCVHAVIPLHGNQPVFHLH